MTDDVLQSAMGLGGLFTAMFSPTEPSVIAVVGSDYGTVLYDIRNIKRLVQSFNKQLAILYFMFNLYLCIPVVFTLFRARVEIRLGVPDSIVQAPVFSALKVILNWSSTIFPLGNSLSRLARLFWKLQIMVMTTGPCTMSVALLGLMTNWSFPGRMIATCTFGLCQIQKDNNVQLTSLCVFWADTKRL